MRTNELPHEFKLDEYIMHHVLNSNEWHVPFLPSIHIHPSISLHVIIMMIVASLMIVIVCLLYKKEQRVPKGFSNVLEIIVIFIRDQISVPALGKEDGHKFTPLFCTFFTFILSMNVLGMIPLFATTTANINVTAPLALVTLFFMTIGAIMKNGIGGFFHALIPSGLPKVMIPVFFLLEFFLLFLKAFALMIRLFANMLAGHMVILSLLGLIVILGWVALPSLLLAVGISVMEVFVAILQAYIFTLLSAVFIGQMYHPEH